jgi:beta-phosphoglucomutase-like phosphatase (HAD superfamily)
MDAHRTEPAVDLDALRSRWRAALRSADVALHRDEGYLTSAELAAHRVRLAAEYGPTVLLLRELARDEGAALHFAQPFLPPAEARALLGLPHRIKACVFDLDGLLAGSAAVHAAAWAQTLEPFLAERAALVHEEPEHLRRFDVHTDYAAFLHGRPRLVGVRTFLASRGIRLPEGSPHDRPGAETVNGLANRKSEAFAHLLEERGVAAYEGSQRYLELAQDAGIACATVSTSSHGEEILERSGLAQLVDVHAGAESAPRARALEACRRLGVEPQEAALFENRREGVEAGRTRGFGYVVGVARPGDAASLREAGADVVVSELGELVRQRHVPRQPLAA